MMFSEAYARMCEILGVRTQVELAETLGIRQSSISDAKRRDAVPACWLLTLLERYQINPSWLLTGAGAKYLVPDLERV